MASTYSSALILKELRHHADSSNYAQSHPSDSTFSLQIPRIPDPRERGLMPSTGPTSPRQWIQPPDKYIEGPGVLSAIKLVDGVLRKDRVFRGNDPPWHGLDRIEMAEYNRERPTQQPR